MNDNITKKAQISDLLAYAPEIRESDFNDIIEQIDTHKYLVNENIPFEITQDQALFSWYENVYHPVIQAIEENGLQAAFPGTSPAKLFTWVCKHWHYLKLEKGMHISAGEAVRSYGARYGKGALRRMIFRMGERAA